MTHEHIIRCNACHEPIEGPRVEVRVCGTGLDETLDAHPHCAVETVKLAAWITAPRDGKQGKR